PREAVASFLSPKARARHAGAGDRGGRIWHKLAAIALAFTIPLALTTYFLVGEKRIKIDFARNELRGDMYLRPASKLLEDVVSHQTVARKALGGAPSSADELRRVEARIDADLEAL